MRCFIALEISEEARRELSRAQSELPKENMKFVEPENLHLTLQFIGEVNEDELERIKEALGKINFSKFNASLGKIGFFPDESYIRVLWASLEPSQVIKDLHAKIHDSIKSIVNLDNRFESHITLARIKSIKDREKFLDKIKSINIEKIGFEAGKFALKKSTLTEKGAFYEEISEFNLT